jgi:hypothetical protein
MVNKRATLNFADDNDTVDITELAGKSKAKKDSVDPVAVQAVAKQSGFPSREASPSRVRRRKRSPYSAQLGLKVRPAMKELFQEVSDHLGVYDHTTFEKALLALIKAEGTEQQLKSYKNIVE